MRATREPEASEGQLAEPPEVNERNLWIGARVIAGTTILFFAAFAFAYFYLRSLNNTGRWRPEGVDPSQRYGLAVVLLFAASAGVLGYAAWAARQERGWLAAAGASLPLGWPACVARCSSMRSCISAARRRLRERVHRLDDLLRGLRPAGPRWVEICLPRVYATATAAVYVPAGLEDAAFYWGLLAGIGVVTWAILYLA